MIACANPLEGLSWCCDRDRRGVLLVVSASSAAISDGHCYPSHAQTHATRLTCKMGCASSEPFVQGGQSLVESEDKVDENIDGTEGENAMDGIEITS